MSRVTLRRQHSAVRLRVTLLLQGVSLRAIVHPLTRSRMGVRLHRMVIHPRRIAGQAIEAVIVTRNRPIVGLSLTAGQQTVASSFARDQTGETERGDGKTFRRSFCILNEECRSAYQTPLSLPVILKATAAADASGGSRLRRNVAGTLPRNAAWVICCVYSLAP